MELRVNKDEILLKYPFRMAICGNMGSGLLNNDLNLLYLNYFRKIYFFDKFYKKIQLFDWNRSKTKNYFDIRK